MQKVENPTGVQHFNQQTGKTRMDVFISQDIAAVVLAWKQVTDTVKPVQVISHDVTVIMLTISQFQQPVAAVMLSVMSKVRTGDELTAGEQPQG